ncbi:IS110 family transposase [Paraburkholderia graminis]|nr:IS110 family transposase [Paraburkholderia graminis]
MEPTVVGVDIAKRVFQLHWIVADTGEVLDRQLRRDNFLEHFANRERCLIGMEACGGSQHWARRLVELGHEVKLMPGKLVKAFVTGNKNDVADARAIWAAAKHPGVRAVPVKTEAQQAVLALHRIRQQLVIFRRSPSNCLRGLLGEYGEVMGVGRAAMNRAMPEVLLRLDSRLPRVLVDSLREQWQRLVDIDGQIAVIEQRLRGWLRENPACRAIAEIPGVGFLTATAAVASMGDPKAFRSGREFAAWLGLVPAQFGTGGKVRLLGISKRGDRYPRTLMIHGARSVMKYAKDPGSWAVQLSMRRPLNVVVVAMANKIARTIWALLAHGRAYSASYPPQAEAA